MKIRLTQPNFVELELRLSLAINIKILFDFKDKEIIVKTNSKKLSSVSLHCSYQAGNNIRLNLQFCEYSTVEE